MDTLSNCNITDGYQKRKINDTSLIGSDMPIYY